MARHERWTFADYADLAMRRGAPSLARFFANCGRGTIPRRIPTDVSPTTVAALVSALAEHRQVEISDVREEDADELFADGEPYPTPWQYYGPYGGHPVLPTALHGVCLAACDECAPEQVWQVRPARRREEAAIWYAADAQDEIFENDCNGYPMLPSRSILVARHTAPFLSADWTDTPFWAVGVAYREVLLGLTALVSPIVAQFVKTAK
jgi:hypothetical protein